MPVDFRLSSGLDDPDEVKSDQPCVPGTNHWFDGKEKETLDQVLTRLLDRGLVAGLAGTGAQLIEAAAAPA